MHVTSKTLGIPRTFNGFPKEFGWCSFIEGSANFGECATHGLGKAVLHNWSDLFKAAQTNKDFNIARPAVFRGQNARIFPETFCSF